MNTTTAAGTVLPGLLVTGVGILGALICSVAYAHLAVYNPLPGYLSPVYAAMYAASVAFVVATAAKAFMCRHRLVVWSSAAVVGVIAVFLAWVSFASLQLATYDVEECPCWLEFAVHPSYLYGFAQWAADGSRYSLFGYAPGKYVHLALWGLEGLIVVAACVSYAPVSAHAAR